jgi:uncharacterized protein YcbK (DUF882 family)
MSYQARHFKAAELQCKCCGLLNVDDRLLIALDEFRDVVGRPVLVRSCVRCPKHNAEVGGAKDSEHLATPILKCRAADIKVPGMTVQEMYEAAAKIPAFHDGGIGAYDGGFIHVDVRRAAKPARWARVDGHYVGIVELVHA